MSPILIGLLGILAVLFFMALRMPISYVMAMVGFVGFSYLTSFSAAYDMVVKELFGTFSSYNFSVIAMFVWMGYLAYHSGIGSKLYVFAYKLIGHWPAGLAIATQFASAIFSAICGSNTAAAATMGAIALPEMKKYNYESSLATASVAAGGVLGALIPPSVLFMVYAMATEQSVGKLFIAGVVPGIMLMFLYIAAIYLLARKNPNLGPSGPVFSWRERWQSLWQGVGEVVLVFSFSMGGLFLGWFTPTEAGSVGAFGILAVALMGRNLSWASFVSSLADTTRTTAMIMLLVAGSVIFGRFMAVSRLPNELANWTAGLSVNPFLIMLVIFGIYLIIGAIMDAMAMMLLTIPIFYPIAVDLLGYDPIWFGVIVVLCAGMGVITPPVGMNVYIIKGIAKEVPLETIFRGITPFLIAILFCLVLLLIFPQLVLYLPNMIKY